MEIRFTVPGIPVAKARPRFVRAVGRTFTPHQTQKAESNVGHRAAEAMEGRPLFTEPVELEIVFSFIWPTSTSKRRRRDSRGAFKETRPDIDNLIKLVADAMDGIVWHTDGCVAVVRAEKRFGQRAETIVTVRPVGGDLLDERPATADRPRERQEAML